MTIVTAPSRSGDIRDVTRMRIAAVPAHHPYVRRVTCAEGLDLLEDPPVPGAAPGVWWPPVVLDPRWIARNAADLDVLHIHFGTESFGPGHLTACVDAAHAAGLPVVFTVHDLTHPQLSDQAPYLAQLDELVPRADALITLTAGAAAEIRDRWQREALVLPHPSILGDAATPAIGALSEDLRIGTHLKDLRPGTDGAATVRALLHAVTALRHEGHPAVAEIRMHPAVRDEGARADIRAALADHPHALLIEQERLPDGELYAALSGLDACVLPYRAGSHSGWLELCWDLGVPVAFPTVGHFGDQHPDGSTAAFDPGDGTSLARALTELLTRSEAARPGSIGRAETADARRETRRRVDAETAAAHAALYRDLRRESAS